MSASNGLWCSYCRFPLKQGHAESCIVPVFTKSVVAQLPAKPGTEIEQLKAELAQAVKERDEAVQLLYLLDKPEARHPDVAAFLDALEYTRK